MSSTLNFKDTQHQFSAYIRDPEHNPAPDNIEQRRMTIYREIFYNNIEGFISNAFPVLRDITSDEAWQTIVRDFMISHHCKTPLFHEIAREFLNYLDNERQALNDPPFIKELAHYEWVELALSVLDAENSQVKQEVFADVLSYQLKTTDLAWPLIYQYPVQQISPSFQPTEPSEVPVLLLVYRDPNDKVTFIELNAVSRRLIDLLNEGKTGFDAAKQIAEELQHPQPDVVVGGAKQLIEDWLKRGVLTQ